MADEGWRLTSQFAVVIPNVRHGRQPGRARRVDGLQPARQDDSVAYIGLQPNVQAALHIGRIAPYASVGVGFDRFSLGGLVSDLVAAEGWNTSASGVGLDLQFGANVIITPMMSAGVAWQIHPGSTEFKLVDYVPTGAGMAFMSIVFSVSYLM